MMMTLRTRMRQEVINVRRKRQNRFPKKPMPFIIISILTFSFPFPWLRPSSPPFVEVCCAIINGPHQGHFPRFGRWCCEGRNINTERIRCRSLFLRWWIFGEGKKVCDRNNSSPTSPMCAIFLFRPTTTAAAVDQNGYFVYLKTKLVKNSRLAKQRPLRGH